MIKTQITGMDRVRKKLASLASRGRTVMREVEQEANRRHAAAMKRRRIPVDTGRLKGSLTEPNHPDRKVSSDARSITIATNVPYAQYQRDRITPRLSGQELKEIFILPIEAAFEQAWRQG